MQGPGILKTVFAAIEKIAPYKCHLLDGIGSLKNITVNDGAVGIAFADNNISEFIMRLRIGPDIDDRIRRLPVIFLGFRSLRSLIKSEEYLKLLASQGIYYLRFPASIAEITNTFEAASKCEIMDPAGAIRDFLPSAGEMTRAESAIIHDLGNFLGSERLLYGACMAGRISGGDAVDLIKKIEVIQNEQSTLNKMDLALHRLTEKRFNDEMEKRRNEKDTSLPDFKSNTLFIDDLAHFGWSDAIAAALWGGDYIHDIGSDKVESVLNISERKSNDGIYFLKSISNNESKKEDDFVNALKATIEKHLDENIHIVLLDLRLRRVEDEKPDGPEKASGAEILQAIRTLNAGIPVVMLTASRRAKNMEKVYDLGADRYFIKDRGDERDNQEIVRDYYHRFREIMEFAMRKAYLGSAWRIISQIEKQNKYDYHLKHIKKAVAFLRKKPTAFESSILKFHSAEEAIINFNIALEGVKDIKWRHDTFDKGNIITTIRNMCAHAGNNHIEEIDAQIILYATLRLFLGDGALFSKLADKINTSVMGPYDAIQLSEQACDCIVALKGASGRKEQWTRNDFVLDYSKRKVDYTQFKMNEFGRGAPTALLSAIKSDLGSLPYRKNVLENLNLILEDRNLYNDLLKAKPQAMLKPYTLQLEKESRAFRSDKKISPKKNEWDKIKILNRFFLFDVYANLVPVTKAPTMAEEIIRLEKGFTEKQLRYLFALAQIKIDFSEPNKNNLLPADHMMYAFIFQNRIKGAKGIA